MIRQKTLRDWSETYFLPVNGNRKLTLKTNRARSAEKKEKKSFKKLLNQHFQKVFSFRKEFQLDFIKTTFK